MIVKGDMFDDGPNHPCKVVGFRDKVRGDIFDTADAPRRKGGHHPYVVFVEQFGDYRMGTTRYENAAKYILGGELSMYKITRISAAESDHGRRLALAGHRYAGLAYIREHTEVLGEFDSYLEARQCWRALGMLAGADYHATDGAIYRLGVAYTD